MSSLLLGLLPSITILTSENTKTFCAKDTISGSLSGINSIKCILYTLWNVYVTHCLPSVVKRKAVITEREDFSKYGSSLFSWTKDLGPSIWDKGQRAYFLT